MLHDLTHAYRMLMRMKGWTIVVLLSLAIGIGATTALFTAVNGLLLQTIPVRDPNELVVLKWSGKNDMVRSSSDYGFSKLHNGERVRSTFSYATYQQLKAANQTMTDLIAGTSLESFNFSSNGSSEIATSFGVSGNYFKVLGVSAIAGRTIEEFDDRPDAEPVAVLSYPFWQRRFGGDASIVGKTVRLNNTPVTVVGVLPPSYIGIQRMLSPPIISFCIAIGTHAAVATPRNDPINPSGATPMIVIGVLLMVTCLPTIDGSPAKRRCQLA